MVAVNAVPSVTGKMAVDARSACGPSLFCDLMSLDQYLAQVRPGGARRARAQKDRAWCSRRMCPNLFALARCDSIAHLLLLDFDQNDYRLYIDQNAETAK